jgi:hypothetical protein
MYESYYSLALCYSLQFIPSISRVSHEDGHRVCPSELFLKALGKGGGGIVLLTTGVNNISWIVVCVVARTYVFMETINILSPFCTQLKPDAMTSKLHGHAVYGSLRQVVNSGPFLSLCRHIPFCLIPHNLWEEH